MRASNAFFRKVFHQSVCKSEAVSPFFERTFKTTTKSTNVTRAPMKPKTEDSVKPMTK